MQVLTAIAYVSTHPLESELCRAVGFPLSGQRRDDHVDYRSILKVNKESGFLLAIT